VRKAGNAPFEYLKVELFNVRLTSLKVAVEQSDHPELVERVSLGFSRLMVSYTPQGSTGGAGGGANVFEADAHSGT